MVHCWPPPRDEYMVHLLLDELLSRLARRKEFRDCSMQARLP